MRRAMTEHEDGQHARPGKRTVEQLIGEWLERRRHKVKPSIHHSYQNLAACYVYPYIGARDARELDSPVFGALYATLLTESRVKARPASGHKHGNGRKRSTPAHARRLAASGQPAGCRPFRYDETRCYGKHAAGDPALGKPITPRTTGPASHRAPVPQPGLAPKTVVSVHRMLHQVWEDAARWHYVRRNVVADASPPRLSRAPGFHHKEVTPFGNSPVHR